MKRTYKLLIASVLFCSCLAGCNNKKTSSSKKSTITFEQWRTIANARPYAPKSSAVADISVSYHLDNNSDREIKGKQYFTCIDGDWTLTKNETGDENINLEDVVSMTAKIYAEEIDTIINGSGSDRFTFKFYKDLSLKMTYNEDSITPGDGKQKGTLKFDSNGFLSYLDAQIVSYPQGYMQVGKYTASIKYSD